MWIHLWLVQLARKLLDVVPVSVLMFVQTSTTHVLSCVFEKISESQPQPALMIVVFYNKCVFLGLTSISITELEQEEIA